MNLNVVLKVFISYNYAPHVFQTLWSSLRDCLGLLLLLAFTVKIVLIGMWFFLIEVCFLFYVCLYVLTSI